LPHMLENNHGHVVTVASMAGKSGTAGLVDYCASKFGAVGFSESLLAELHALNKDGVYVTTVCPYYIDTGMFDGVHTQFVLLHLLLQIIRIAVLLVFSRSLIQPTSSNRLSRLVVSFSVRCYILLGRAHQQGGIDSSQILLLCLLRQEVRKKAPSYINQTLWTASQY
jgi:hypothetical protein